MRDLFRCLVPAAFIVVSLVPLWAQTGGGATLVGTIRDSTGAVVAGAKVSVVNTATAFFTENITSAEGAYYVPYLAPGEYRVKVNAAGFKEFVREGITLRSSEVPRVDITLALGSVNESVTVSASASLLNTENVLSAYVISKEALVESGRSTCCSICRASSASSAKPDFIFKARIRTTSVFRWTASARNRR